jgi:multidrug resistance efflux pump
MIQEELQKLEKLARQASLRISELSAENQLLKEKLGQAESQLSQREQEIENFKIKIKITNIVDNRTVNPEDSAEMSELINNYIKEIDHLIDYLSE